MDQPTEKRPAVFLRAVFQTGALNVIGMGAEHKAKTLEEKYLRSFCYFGMFCVYNI